MEKEQILEGNILIADFYGKKHPDNDNFYIIKIQQGYDGNYHKQMLQFHKSWDWLMPVVEKIEKIGYQIKIALNSCEVCNTELNILFEKTKIESVWLAVIEFIKWYNKSKL